MSGYTPVFDTVLDGTLFGKWPHTGIWVCLLSQCDRRGNIDVVPALLAAKIGVPVTLLLECILDFMKPDPGSRTGDLDGRRLELIDPASREWGWRVINHSSYREKARKSSYDRQRTESGADAARKKESRQASREVPTRPAALGDSCETAISGQKPGGTGNTDEYASNASNYLVPRCPDQSREVPLSEAEANNKKEKPPAAIAPESISGLDVETWKRWIEYRKGIKKPIKAPSMEAAMRDLASYGAQQSAVVEQSIANSYQGLFALKAHGAAQAKASGGRFKTA